MSELTRSIARSAFALGVVVTKKTLWEQIATHRQPMTTGEVLELLSKLEVSYPEAPPPSTEASEAPSESEVN